jgi:broad specificity phosphatase PhoE
MKIYLIRHGETTGDIEDRFGGDYEDHLTKKGQNQASELGHLLEDKNIEVILHSPRIRAIETATIVSKVINAPLEEIHDLRERNNYGILTGLTKTEAEEKFPEEFAKIQKDKTYHDVQNSESYDKLKKRVIKAFDEIGKRDNQVIAIITHGGVIGSVAREIFGHPQIKIGDCGIIEIDYDGKSHKIVSLTGASLLQ